MENFSKKAKIEQVDFYWKTVLFSVDFSECLNPSNNNSDNTLKLTKGL